MEALELEKPSLQVPSALFRILMGPAQCHYACFFFAMARKTSNKSFIFFFYEREGCICEEREACSDMKSSCFLRMGCSPQNMGDVHIC